MAIRWEKWKDLTTERFGEGSPEVNRRQQSERLVRFFDENWELFPEDIKKKWRSEKRWARRDGDKASKAQFLKFDHPELLTPEFYGDVSEDIPTLQERDIDFDPAKGTKVPEVNPEVGKQKGSKFTGPSGIVDTIGTGLGALGFLAGGALAGSGVAQGLSGASAAGSATASGGAGASGASGAGASLPSIAQGSNALALDSVVTGAGGSSATLGGVGAGTNALNFIDKAAIPAKRGSSTLLSTLKNAGNAASIGSGLGSVIAGASVPSGIPGVGPLPSPSRRRSSSLIKSDSTDTEAEAIAGLLTGEAEMTPEERRRTRIPRRTDPAIEEARRSAIREERERTGRQSTILTSGRGVTEPLGEVDRPRARRRTNPVARERIPALLGA